MYRQSIGFLPIPVGHGMMFAVQGCPFDAFNHKTFGLYFEEGTVRMGAPAVALGVSPTSAQPEELYPPHAKGANGIDLQAAAPSKVVDKSKLN